MFKWYKISVDNAELSKGLIFSFHYQLHKYALYLSPHVRLAGMTKEAHIETKELAEEFKEKCLPIKKKRYGDDTTLTVEEWSTPNVYNSLKKRIDNDTKIIKARLAQNNVTPNKKVNIAP
jgi:hypothetical protein